MTDTTITLHELAVELNEPILQFFEYSHLPPTLASVSAQFSQLAISIAKNLPRNPERTVALRKLLESKDAGVRAVVYKSTEGRLTHSPVTSRPGSPPVS